MAIQSNVNEEFEVINSCNIRIHAYWSQYRLLFTTSDEQVSFLSKVASGFFAVVRDSLRDNIFIMIARLTDPPKTGSFQNMSLNLLVESLEGKIAAPEFSVIKDRVKGLNIKCEGIREWRKKWFAHIDRDFALSNDPTLLRSVKRGEIDAIIREIDDVLKLIAISLGLAVSHYEIDVFGDAQDLVTALKKSNSRPN
jgi:hypothetical protein